MVVPAVHGNNSIWWYLLHSPEQYVWLAQAPAWLVGSLMAVFSAITGAVSMTLLKLAYERQAKRAKELAREMEEAFDDDEPEVQDRKRRKSSFASMIEMEQAGSRSLPWYLSPLFWLGLLLYLVAGALQVLALTYAPETTVAPLGVVLVITNVPLAYGILHERFSHGDLLATGVCILSMSVAVFAMPRNIPGHLKDFPVKEFIEFSYDMTNNYGFLCYLIVWIVLVLFCLNGQCIVQSKVKRPMRAVTMPTLAGLFLAAFSFFVKLFGTLFYHSDDHPEVWSHRSTHVITGFMLLLGLVSLMAVCQGIRSFDCRFFVPTTFAVTTVLMIVQGFLFFKEYEGMEFVQVLCFGFACFTSVSSVFFISWERNTVHKPASSAAGLEADSPLALVPMPQPTKEEMTVLTIMEEHGTRAIEKPNDWHLDGANGFGNSIVADHENRFSYDTSSGESNSETDSEFFSHSSSETTRAPPYADVGLARRYLSRRRWMIWSALLRLHPLLAFISGPLVIILAFKFGYAWQAFTLLTIYSGYYDWKFGFHIALFSNVGRMKMKAYASVDFEEMFHKLAAYPEAPEALACMKFEDVRHFVILTCYKEDLQIMKEAILSVADSKIAKRQIGLVLAMEEREDGAAEKATKIIEEVGSLFRHALYTLHPPGLPGEVPGKSANCRWAAQKLFEEHLPSLGYDLKRVVLTVMDADSEFHPEYYAALTYQFLTAPGDEARFNTIWQAPILHYKNYHSQPPIVRLGSLLASQHELANLADPTSTRIPYSTYSISGVLAKAVDGWDPDWISEDWHMCCKCFCATLGMLKIAPIFLPVMNYTPEADNCVGTLWARWTQAKRHALGVSELVYFAGSVPPILCDRRFSLRRRMTLFARGLLLWEKMAVVHGMMATSTIMALLNGVFVSYYIQNQLLAKINSFTFLANCVFQFLSMFTFVFYLYTNVRLYDKVAYRIAGYGDPSISAWWGRTSLHFLTLVVGSFPTAPFLFTLGGVCEWIAAVKTAVTHKFDYVVALKPQAASAKTI